MARETKVGLIVGLGLILFVSIMVSEYFVDSPAEDAIDPQAMSDFGNATNNPATNYVRADDGDASRPDPQQLAAITVDRLDPGYTRTTRGQQESVEPPFQYFGPGYGDSGETPVATSQRNTNTVGRLPVDEPGLDNTNQLTVRVGPGGDDTSQIAHVELPNLEEQNRGPTQIRHTVAPNETLTQIARKYYNGDGNMWYSIRDANDALVGPNGEVREGVILVIPQRSTEQESDDGLAQLTGTTDNRPQRTQVRIITVERGDTLSGLAAEHLGSAGRYRMIYDVNTDTMDSENDLREGMRLRIPTMQTVEIVEQAEDALTNRPDDAGQAQTPPAQRTYTVVAGDNLYRIAQQTLGDGERYREIFQANRNQLDAANDIRVGMELRIPER